MVNAIKTTLFLALAIVGTGCMCQNNDEIKRKSYHIITSNYYQNNGNVTGIIENILNVYCRENGRLPTNPDELKMFAIANYHPNDLIIDDFESNELRFNKNYKGGFVVYFIGPDGVDDLCKKQFYPDAIAGIKYEEYLELEGDFILGGIDLNTVKYLLE